MIELKAIRSASSAQSYTRGNQVYKNRKIYAVKTEQAREMLEISAMAEGSGRNEYQVHLSYNLKTNRFDDFTCECEAYYSYSGMCKHCVGTALYVYYQSQNAAPAASGAKKEKASAAPPTSQNLAQVMFLHSMKEKARYFQPEITGRIELVPCLNRKAEQWSVEFKIGAEHKYVLKNISRFVSAVQDNQWVEYGKKLAFYHDRSVFAPKSQKLLNMMEECVAHERDMLSSYHQNIGYNYSYYYSEPSYEDMVKRQLVLTDVWMVKFAELYAGESCAMNVAELGDIMEFVQEDPKLAVKVAAGKNGGYTLNIPAAEVFQGLERMCIRIKNRIYVCSRELSEKMRDLGPLFNGLEQKFPIHPKDASSFCASVLPVLLQYTDCSVTEELKQYEPKPCQIKVYLDWQDEAITASAECSYGEDARNLLEDSLSVSELHRDFEKEQSLQRVLNTFFPDIDRKRQLFIISENDDDAVYWLIQEGIPQLQRFGELFVSDRLKRLREIPRPKVSVGITIRSGILDIDIRSDQLPLNEIEGILAGYRRKRKFYRLADGTFLSLEDNGLAAVAELAEGLAVNGDDLAGGHLHIPEYRSFYLDQVLREKGQDLEVKRSREFKALIREMKNVEDSDFDVPGELQAKLRPYQKFGYRWMMTLSRMGFGGILADDMGLGKTVQAIAYLLAQKNKGSAGGDEPDFMALIVCPASLVYNWESELRRFAPSLCVCTAAGSAASRREQLEAKKGDVLLTSYDLLKRDSAQYETLQFGHMIIDEAQNIKNYTTQAAKAVKAVSCRYRFALTGTPIENSLSELWSIFDFLMPGILSTNKQFKERYEQPIVSSQDSRVMERLKNMIRPFILRRKKSEVLKELPDKIEKTMYSQMETEQAKLYAANLQKLLYSLNNQSPEEFRTGKLQILAELTKLRQICCDPAMVYSDYRGGAAKVDTCIELIRSAAAAKNQLLLFSQFTSALEIIAKRLKNEGIPYYELTGSTSKEKRASLVEAFNRDGTPVFLISLKAGGTGLNLTAASMVIHFDPWWNMAAQNQATDRAHRIGQKQVVTVYQLIMKDTLEEKIQHLQEQKARLSDEVISGGSVRDTLATKEELLELLGEC